MCGCDGDRIYNDFGGKPVNRSEVKVSVKKRINVPQAGLVYHKIAPLACVAKQNCFLSLLFHFITLIRADPS